LYQFVLRPVVSKRAHFGSDIFYQVQLFWIVTPCSVGVVHQRFGILPHHTASQSRKTRLKISQPWKSENSHS